MKKLISAVLLMTSASAWAVENGGVYMGATAARISTDAGAFSVDFHGVGPTLGYRVNRYVSVEGSYLFGVGDDSLNLGGVPVKFELEHYVSAAMLAHYPVTDVFSVWARGGYGSAKLKASAMGFSESETDSGLAWGFGVQAGVRNWAARVGYERPTGDSDADGLSLTFMMTF
jgi:outer membrane immunogenic protein